MALPKHVETPRGLALKAKLDTAFPLMQDWPMPSKDDIVIIGGIIIIYSYVEFQLRRLAEAFDYANLLPTESKGNSAYLDVGRLEQAIRSTSVWNLPHDVEALDELASFRPVRNLLAHFTVRRFPDEEAFVFITKNANDYKKVLGLEPAIGVAMTAVVERAQLHSVLRRIEHLHNWLAKAVVSFEKRLLSDAAFEAGNSP